MVIFIIGLLFVCPVVFAKNNGNGEKPTIREKNRFENQLGNYASNVTGLENAILRVRNEETAVHLTQVMAKIEEKRMEQLRKKSDLLVEETVEGDVEVSFRENARFLGLLKVPKKARYELSNTGELTYKKGPWDFLFSQEDLDPLE